MKRGGSKRVDDGYLNESQTQSLTQTQLEMLPHSKPSVTGSITDISQSTAAGTDSKTDDVTSSVTTGTLDNGTADSKVTDSALTQEDGVDGKDGGRVDEEVESQTPYDFSTLPSHACSYCGVLRFESIEHSV